MLNLSNITIRLGGNDIISGVSFQLNPGNKVGLIGRNGVGKSTLLKAITGDIEIAEGQISVLKGHKIGYLKQDIDFVDGATVLEETYEAFDEIKKIENQLTEKEQALATRTDFESDDYMQLLHDFHHLQEAFQVAGGYQYKGEAEKVLKGLGFNEYDFDKRVETFSGGWRMRIELAKILLQNNDILLLDEPTNHLDIESILWFENFLKNYKGILMVVSHDQMFLDNVTNRTIELNKNKIYDFPKPYSEFMKIKAELIEKQQQAAKNQEKEIKEMEQLIEKFRYKATKASFAQSLIKKLEKMERIEVDTVDNKTMTIRFPVAQPSGKIVFDIQHLGKNYGDKKVLNDINLIITKGERLAFVGQNGTGKTTLAKMLVGELTPTDGQLKIGHNVKIGYFAQNQSEYLNPNLTVLETIEAASDDSNRTKVRDILGAFLFSGDEVHKKVSVLSGGERNRLALAVMMLQQFNVLVMDEPTNHLDIHSKDVLQQALLNFDGTLIVVSHDRHFLQGLSDKTIEFKDKNIKVHLGDIDYFLQERQAENFRDIELKKEAKIKETKNSAGQSYEQRKANRKRQKQLKNKLGKTEEDIEKQEAVIKEMEMLLSSDNPPTEPEFFEKYNEAKAHLETLMETWEAIHLELETLE
ncbi:MAG TPA: ABC transporter ATP-binding protein [Flavobacteriales bacterium]|jgi:ATP-binding cassette subfamily F protein 3|nr:ABC transporter ATP-binding protein [Flavobacteriales bacterium]